MPRIGSSIASEQRNSLHSSPSSPKERSPMAAKRKRNSIEKNTKVTIDFKKLALPLGLAGAETDSNRTPREANIIYNPNILLESQRSKHSNTASIVKEIENMTKYTEAEIRASIQISSEEQEINPRLPERNSRL